MAAQGRLDLAESVAKIRRSPTKQLGGEEQPTKRSPVHSIKGARFILFFEVCIFALISIHPKSFTVFRLMILHFVISKVSCPVEAREQ